MALTRDWYEGFQRAEFDGWDATLSDDVLLNSPVGFGVRGLRTFKDFARQFTDLAYRIDLVDEHLALDGDGNGRRFVTINPHWKHTNDFGGLTPTGREGTSVETVLLTIEGNTVVRTDVADNRLDFPSTCGAEAGRAPQPAARDDRRRRRSPAGRGAVTMRFGIVGAGRIGGSVAEQRGCDGDEAVVDFKRPSAWRIHEAGAGVLPVRLRASSRTPQRLEATK